MWQRSFVATTVALGETVDDALDHLGEADGLANDAAGALVAGLRSPQRPARAAALATALRDIVFALDGVSLR